MLLKAMDQIYGVGQFVGKFYGFLDRRDGGVTESIDAEQRIARFLSDGAGWEEMSIPLPEDAVFDHAMTGLLTRTGAWKTPQSVEAVTRFLDPYRTQVRAVWEPFRNGVRLKTELSPMTRLDLRVVPMQNLTAVIIQQARASEQLGESMKSRLRSLSDTRR